MAKTSGGNRGGKSGSDVASKAVAGVESLIRGNSYESAAIFDASGKQLLFKKGEARQVEFTREEVAKMNDAILTHNHPSGLKDRYKIGSSFSDEDIMMATYANAKEIRAVTARYSFSMKRPEQGWGTDIKTTKKGLKIIEASVRRKLQSYVDNYKGNVIDAIDRANVLHYHLKSKELAKMMGWNYTKTKIK